MSTDTDHLVGPYGAEAIIEDVRGIFVAVGVPAADAHLVAHSLVTSEIWGHPSHGLLRTRWYIERIRTGTVRPDLQPETVVDGGAIAVMDGRDALGQVVADRAMRDAVRRSRDHGVGIVSVRDSNHFGTAAYYARWAAKQGCVALLVTNSSPAMAPWGARDKVLGANPWSIAAPAGDFGEVVMDISNTVVARGKIYTAREQGTAIPDGWALDAAGRPTTDPVEAAAGLLQPIGGHKGYAISFMMDVLTGVLAGSASGRDVRGPQQAEERSRCSHFAMAIDIASVGAPDEFAARMQALIEQTRSAPLAEGHDRTYVPGELEAIAQRRADREGVRLSRRTVDDVRVVAEELGVSLEVLGT